MSYNTLINHEYKYILFWNQKVACSYVKRWYLASLGFYKIKEGEDKARDLFSEDFNVHNFIKRNKLMFFVKKKDLGLYKDYKKVVIVRDPLDRLASFYRDKVIRNRWSQSDHRNGLGKISVYKGAFESRHENYKKGVVACGSLSFHQLGNMVCKVDDSQSELHLVGQARGLAGIVFDHIINISDGANLGESLNNIFDLNITNKKFNNTIADSRDAGTYASVANEDAAWFRDKGIYPSSDDLYTDRLKKLVMNRYRKDYLRFFSNKPQSNLKVPATGKKIERHPLTLIREGDVCVEVGVWKGDFSKKILSKKPKELHLVDPWVHQNYKDRWYSAGQEKMDEIFKEVMVSVGRRSNVIIHRAYSTDVVFPNKYFDWVYIDANHSYEAVLSDLSFYYPLIKPGGFLCGDDYGWTDEDCPDGPKREVDEFAEDMGLEKIIKNRQFTLKVK